MIGKLKGVIEELGEDFVLLDVHGVCYVVLCSARTLLSVGKVGDPCILHTETYVREDQLKLFGFHEIVEREWFLLLQTVQGIGAKLALAVLSTLTANQLANAISLQDKSLVSQAPGVGPKVAQRIVLELKGKLPKVVSDQGDATLFQQLGKDVSSPVIDAISALTNLGYSRDQAANAISAVVKEVGDAAEGTTLIRLGLKQLSKMV